MSTSNHTLYPSTGRRPQRPPTWIVGGMAEASLRNTRPSDATATSSAKAIDGVRVGLKE